MCTTVDRVEIVSCIIGGLVHNPHTFKNATLRARREKPGRIFVAASIAQYHVVRARDDFVQVAQIDRPSGGAPLADAYGDPICRPAIPQFVHGDERAPTEFRHHASFSAVSRFHDNISLVIMHGTMSWRFGVRQCMPLLFFWFGSWGNQ